jgi:hypothetical protein
MANIMGREDTQWFPCAGSVQLSRRLWIPVDINVVSSEASAVICLIDGDCGIEQSPGRKNQKRF